MKSSIGHTAVEQGPKNYRTVVADSSLSRQVRPPAAQGAFAGSFAHLVRLAEVAPTGSWLIAAMSPSGQPVGPVLVRPQSICVAGRHSEVDLELPVPDIALRHVAFHVSAVHDDAATSLRVWDLHTDFRFTTEDGAETAAVSADGPTFLALGMYRIIAMPVATVIALPQGDAEAAWSALPPRTVRDLDDSSDSELRPGGIAEPEVTAERDHFAMGSTVTRLRGALTPADIPLPSPDAVANLVLQTPHGTDTLAVTGAMLDRGILIGRYSRCSNRRNDDEALSRVHALIARHGDQIFLIDTASTNGTFLDGRRIRAHKLKNRFTLFALGTRSALAWQPR